MKETPFSPLDHQWMSEALTQARLAMEHGDIPVGAVIVHNGHVIGRGHNRREIDKDPTAHAEILALRQAGSTLDSWRLTEAVMYVTLEPCAMCAAALVQSRLARVIFGADDPPQGACGSLLNLVQFPGFPHGVPVAAGLMARESLTLLQAFFARCRQESEGRARKNCD